MPAPLLSRSLDPLLGVFTGFLAYYLHETHPRTNLPPGYRLTELIEWKWAKHKQQREERLRASESLDKL
ncbi:hypothetical protein AX16_004756 [Volvariella volvacea WC 439]|nr:hypothetical protein AX16_004756 [Volvariella volvacea WC 439]